MTIRQSHIVFTNVQRLTKQLNHSKPVWVLLFEKRLTASVGRFFIAAAVVGDNHTAY
jgi:hypothetical protein